MKLEEMLGLQDRLNAKFGMTQEAIMKLPLDDRLQVVRNYLEALVIEVGEAIKSSKGRWWKKDKDWKGDDDLKEELVDCFHFLFSAWLVAGGSAGELHRMYCEKNNTNHIRKDWKVNE